MFDAYQYLNQYIISQVINSELRSTFANLESFFFFMDNHFQHQQGSDTVV